MYFDIWGKTLSHKKVKYNYTTKMFTRRAKPIRKTSVRISGVLLYLQHLSRPSILSVTLYKLLSEDEARFIVMFKSQNTQEMQWVLFDSINSY